jgi:hypothetical protein
MTQRLPDLEMVGKVYAEMFRVTGHDWPARNAAVTAWRERHPTVNDQDADLAVARLIVEAIDAGLVWGRTQSPELIERLQPPYLRGMRGAWKVQDDVRHAMTQTEKFIARLHFIANGSDPLDRQIAAVADLFAQFLEEARQSLGDDPQRMRSRLTGLQFELTKQALPPRDDRVTDLREHASKLVKDWLLKNLI